MSAAAFNDGFEVSFVPYDPGDIFDLNAIDPRGAVPQPAEPGRPDYRRPFCKAVVRQPSGNLGMVGKWIFASTQAKRLAA